MEPRTFRSGVRPDLKVRPSMHSYLPALMIGVTIALRIQTRP